MRPPPLITVVLSSDGDAIYDGNEDEEGTKVMVTYKRLSGGKGEQVRIPFSVNVYYFFDPMFYTSSPISHKYFVNKIVEILIE